MVSVCFSLRYVSNVLPNLWEYTYYFFFFILLYFKLTDYVHSAEFLKALLPTMPLSSQAQAVSAGVFSSITLRVFQTFPVSIIALLSRLPPAALVWDSFYIPNIFFLIILIRSAVLDRYSLPGPCQPSPHASKPPPHVPYNSSNLVKKANQHLGSLNIQLNSIKRYFYRPTTQFSIVSVDCPKNPYIRGKRGAGETLVMKRLRRQFSRLWGGWVV